MVKDVWIYGQIDTLMNEWINGCIDTWIDGYVNGWMVGHGYMNGSN